MNGPDHYRAAERELMRVQTEPMGPERQVSHLLEAQVHATLALATAILAAAGWHVGGRWSGVAGE